MFSCLCYASNTKPPPDKFSPKAIPGVFMGYSLTQKGCKIYEFHTKSFFISRNAVFRESIFSFLHAKSFGLPLFPVFELPILDDTQHSTTNYTSSVTPVQGEITSVIPSTTSSQLPSQDTSPILPSPNPPISRKSTIIRHPPAWMNDFVTTSTKSSSPYPISSYVSYSHVSQPYKQAFSIYSSISEPSSFHQASQDPAWINTMKLEVTILEDNHIWTIVDLPVEKHLLGVNRYIR